MSKQGAYGLTDDEDFRGHLSDHELVARCTAAYSRLVARPSYRYRSTVNKPTIDPMPNRSPTCPYRAPVHDLDDSP